MPLIELRKNRTIMFFDSRSGLPTGLKHAITGRNYISGVKQPFFRIALKDRNGAKCSYTGIDAATAHISGKNGGILVYFNFIGQRNLNVKCSVTYNDYTDFDFGIEIRNETGCRIESVEYPIFLAPGVIESEESDWVLWHHCFFNGILTHGIKNLMRGPSWLTESGFASPVQMCAFGTSTESLYFCTKDTANYCRDMQPIWDGTCARISSIHYCDQEDHARFKLPYTAGLSFLDGSEWYDSAGKYREWAEKQEWCSKKLWEKDIPEWWLDSPIVLSIKERSKRNKEMNPKPSPWCHPLEKGIERIRELAAKFESKINVQVFHWEKEGAFVNGDHFPPLSGYEGTRKFFDLLHKSGCFGGVYILPSKWCLKAETTGYDGSEFFDEHDAAGSVCCDENLNPICSNYDWEWRKRYMICATTPEGRKEIIDAFKVFAGLGADYIQYDTFNGRLRNCWSEKHGHYPGNGKWQNDASISIIKEIQGIPEKFILTVEAQPNEWIIPMVHGFVERGVHPKSEEGWETVPLYQYIYHQYVQGFAGEDCGPFNQPENFFLIEAITIVSGDMLMINLGTDGRIVMIAHEDHLRDYTVENVYPAELVEGFIKDMNRLRREYASEFLVRGRMEKPPEIKCAVGKILEAEFHTIKVPAVLGSSWTSPAGEKGTVLVNYTAHKQEISVRLRYDAGNSASATDTHGNIKRIKIADNSFSYEIGPYDAVIVKSK